MTDLLRLTVLLLVVVNPVSVALAARTASEGQTQSQRLTMLATATAVGIAVLGGAALTSGTILDALEISPPAAQLAAGIVLLVPTFELLFGGPGDWVRPARAASPVRVGAFPLGVPVLATPWAVVAVLAFAGAEGGGTTAGAAVLASVACVALAALYSEPADARAVRMLGIAVGVATALIAADLLRDGVLAT